MLCGRGRAFQIQGNHLEKDPLGSFLRRVRGDQADWERKLRTRLLCETPHYRKEIRRKMFRKIKITHH